MGTRNLIRASSLSVILWAVLIALYPCGVANAETSSGIAWRSIETGHTIIRYQTGEDLKEFDDSVDYSPGEWGIKLLFSSREPGDLPGRLGKKVDSLYARVMEILDMRKKLKKVTINIYRDKEQLHSAHYDIYKTGPQYRAWYIYENNTIYVNADDLTAGILAHEIAHSIIDNFLVIRPPNATAEILTRYVDSHLVD